jgi:hypothetical protein
MTYFEPELDFITSLPPAADTHGQKFAAYHKAHPEIYAAIKREALATVGRISTKRIYETLRGRFPHLDNSYTGDYADMLCDEYHAMAARIERRRRPERKMKLVYTK